MPLATPSTPSRGQLRQKESSSPQILRGRCHQFAPTQHAFDKSSSFCLITPSSSLRKTARSRFKPVYSRKNRIFCFWRSQTRDAGSIRTRPNGSLNDSFKLRIRMRPIITAWAWVCTSARIWLRDRAEEFGPIVRRNKVQSFPLYFPFFLYPSCSHRPSPRKDKPNARSHSW